MGQQSVQYEGFVRLQAYGKTTVSGSPFRVKCMPPKADPDNSTVTMLQEHAFIDDIVKAGVRTVDQFGESCPSEGGVTAQVLDAQTEKVLFDARIVETGNVCPFLAALLCLLMLQCPLNGTKLRLAVRSCQHRTQLTAFYAKTDCWPVASHAV